MPKVDKYQDELAKKHTKMKKIDWRGEKAYPALNKKSGGGSIANNTATGILEGKPNEIKVAIGYMNNLLSPAQERRDGKRQWRRYRSFAHLTTNVAEITMYADVVLPARITMFEKWAFVKQKQNRYAHVALIQPVVEPMWDVKHDETEIPFLIAEKLKEKGFPNLYDYLTKEFKDPETDVSPEDRQGVCALFREVLHTSCMGQSRRRQARR